MATNTKKVKGLQIPFKEFMPGQLIISSQFNDDMKDIEDKVNEIIDEHNVMSEEIDAHTDNTENPHQVNAHQVGTYDSGEIDEFVNDLRNGEFNDNVIENNVLADDCIDTRNYRDASITSSKVEPSFGSQLDISENIEIRTRYTKQETDELIKTKVGDGTYSKEELDTKFEEVQAGVIIDSTIGIEKLKPNVGNELDISRNVNIRNKYTKDEVDYLIKTNALPRDWGSILEADENESFQSNDTGIFPVADYMVSDMFISPASNVLDFDIKEVVDSRNGHNSLNERLTEDNKKHNFYINALLDENTGNRLSVESDKNTITLKDCKEGFVEIKKIVGNTLSTSGNVQSTFEDKLVTQEMIDSGIEKKENLGKYKVGAKVVGKNKIDFKNIKILNTNSSTHEVINGGLRIKYSGVNTSTSKSYTYIRSELYEINPDVKRLILSYKHNSNKNQKPRILVKLFDSKTSSTSIKDYSVTGFTNMEIPQNAKYYQLVIYSCNGEAGIVKGDYVDYIDVQLEEVLDSSINTTQYEPYKECITNVYLNSPLAKGDEIVAKEDGLYHYHKMKKVVLDNNSKLSMPNSVYQPINTNYVIFGYEDNTIKTNVTCHCDRFNVLPSSTVSKNLASEGVWVHSTTNSIRICVLKSKLTPVDVSGFNKWLQDNPITIIYELTKPYYEKISDDKFISRISSGATLHIENTTPHQSVTVNYTGGMPNVYITEAVFVEDFGAVGDYNEKNNEGTDDTEAIQKAIDYAHKNKISNVRFGSKGYLITDRLYIKEGITLIGTRESFTQTISTDTDKGANRYRVVTETTLKIKPKQIDLTPLNFQNQTGLKNIAIVYDQNFASSLESEIIKYAVTIKAGHGFSISNVCFKGAYSLMEIKGESAKISKIYGWSFGTAITLKKSDDVSFISDIHLNPNVTRPTSNCVDLSRKREDSIALVLEDCDGVSINNFFCIAYRTGIKTIGNGNVGETQFTINNFFMDWIGLAFDLDLDCGWAQHISNGTIVYGFTNSPEYGGFLKLNKSTNNIQQIINVCNVNCNYVANHVVNGVGVHHLIFFEYIYGFILNLTNFSYDGHCKLINNHGSVTNGVVRNGDKYININSNKRNLISNGKLLDIKNNTPVGFEYIKDEHMQINAIINDDNYCELTNGDDLSYWHGLFYRRVFNEKGDACITVNFKEYTPNTTVFIKYYDDNFSNSREMLAKIDNNGICQVRTESCKTVDIIICPSIGKSGKCIIEEVKLSKWGYV